MRLTEPGQSQTDYFGDGRYRVGGLVHRGHHAVVYQAVDGDTGERVALKVFDAPGVSSDILQAMFDKEVASLSRLKHPNVVVLKRHFLDERTGLLCLVLEYIPNSTSLAEVIRRVSEGEEEARPNSWVLDSLQDIIDAVEAAHSLGIVHRDLNPNNILVSRVGEVETIKIIDFGIAKLIDQFGVKHTTLPHFLTYPYVSPEQVSNRGLSLPHDYFTFGLLATALLTWRLPEQAHLLTGEEIHKLLDLLKDHVADSLFVEKLSELVKGLTREEPYDRTKPHAVRKALRDIQVGLGDRPTVGLLPSGSVREKVLNAGFASMEAFMADLNDGAVAEYQEANRNGRVVNVYFEGRNAWVLTKTDSLAGNEEQLVMVDAGRHDDGDRRLVNRGQHCRFRLRVGRGNAKALMDDLYERQSLERARKERERSRYEFTKVSRAILEIEEQRAKSLELSYASLDRETSPGLLRMQVVSMSALDSASGERALIDDDRVSEALVEVEQESVFTIERHRRSVTVGTFEAYLAESRTLVVRPTPGIRLPESGKLSYVDKGQLVAIGRQRAALQAFVKEDAHNPSLADRVMDPRTNTSGTRPSTRLVQPLRPAHEVSDLVEHALAAQDMYFVQGPPGTGKTAIIVEFMLQVLRQDSRARILLTAQPNQAVKHAFDEFGPLNNGRHRSVLFTRASSEPDALFNEWVEEVRTASMESEEAVIAGLSSAARAAAAEALELWRERLSTAADVREDYFRSVQVFGATCLRVPSLLNLTRDEPFDWVIVDEAAKALDSELLTALQAGRRFLLVGDQRQLPPYLDRNVQEALADMGIPHEQYAKSLFERLYEQTRSSNRRHLKRQFRMHSTIGQFVSDLFYSDLGGLEHGTPDSERDLPLPWLAGYSHRVIWFDVNGKERRAATSYYNIKEANVARMLLQELNRQAKAQDLRFDVSVISPYRSQVSQLEDAVLPKSFVWTNLSISIATIDSFQGEQSDLVLYSLVRTNPEGLRFVADRQRLNVSFSRAKRALLILGSVNAAVGEPILEQALRLIPTGNVIRGKR